MNKLDVNSDMYRIVGCAMTVYNKMKHGFNEKVYERCLDIELKKQGLSVRRQVKITAYYDNAVAGVFVADMVVNANVVVELKAAHHLAKMHEEQIQEYDNYLGKTNDMRGLRPHVRRPDSYIHEHHGTAGPRPAAG